MGFVEMRREKGKRAPLTLRAARMVLKRLGQFHAEGLDANEALERSTRNGWSDVWPGTRVVPQPPPAQRNVAGGVSALAEVGASPATLPQGRAPTRCFPQMSEETRAMVHALKARLRSGKAGQ